MQLIYIFPFRNVVRIESERIAQHDLRAVTVLDDAHLSLTPCSERLADRTGDRLIHQAVRRITRQITDIDRIPKVHPLADTVLDIFRHFTRQAKARQLNLAR